MQDLGRYAERIQQFYQGATVSEVVVDVLPDPVDGIVQRVGETYLRFIKEFCPQAQLPSIWDRLHFDKIQFNVKNVLHCKHIQGKARQSFKTLSKIVAVTRQALLIHLASYGLISSEEGMRAITALEVSQYNMYTIYKSPYKRVQKSIQEALQGIESALQRFALRPNLTPIFVHRCRFLELLINTVASGNIPNKRLERYSLHQLIFLIAASECISLSQNIPKRVIALPATKSWKRTLEQHPAFHPINFRHEDLQGYCRTVFADMQGRMAYCILPKQAMGLYTLHIHEETGYVRTYFMSCSNLTGECRLLLKRFKPISGNVEDLLKHLYPGRDVEAIEPSLEQIDPSLHEKQGLEPLIEFHLQHRPIKERTLDYEFGYLQQYYTTPKSLTPSQKNPEILKGIFASIVYTFLEGDTCLPMHQECVEKLLKSRLLPEWNKYNLEGLQHFLEVVVRIQAIQSALEAPDLEVKSKILGLLEEIFNPLYISQAASDFWKRMALRATWRLPHTINCLIEKDLFAREEIREIHFIRELAQSVSIRGNLFQDMAYHGPAALFYLWNRKPQIFDNGADKLRAALAKALQEKYFPLFEKNSPGHLFVPDYTKETAGEYLLMHSTLDHEGQATPFICLSECSFTALENLKMKSADKMGAPIPPAYFSTSTIKNTPLDQRPEYHPYVSFTPDLLKLPPGIEGLPYCIVGGIIKHVYEVWVNRGEKLKNHLFHNDPATGSVYLIKQSRSGQFFDLLQSLYPDQNLIPIFSNISN